MSGNYDRGHGIWVGQRPSKDGAPSRGNSICKGTEAGEELPWRKTRLDDAGSLARPRSMGSPMSRAPHGLKQGVVGRSEPRAVSTLNYVCLVSPQLSPKGPESQPGAMSVGCTAQVLASLVFSSDWCLSPSRAPQTRVRPRALRPTRQPKCSRPSSPCMPCQAWPLS